MIKIQYKAIEEDNGISKITIIADKTYKFQYRCNSRYNDNKSKTNNLSKKCNTNIDIPKLS